jgi:hypothetical protein
MRTHSINSDDRNGIPNICHAIGMLVKTSQAGRYANGIEIGLAPGSIVTAGTCA